MLKKATIAVLFSTLAGCASVAPMDDYDRDKIIEAARSSQASIKPVSLEDARLLAAGWRDKLESAAVSRERQAMVADEVLYYGTLILTGAQAAIASKGAAAIPHAIMYARNAGAAGAIGSTLYKGHYKPGIQQPIFEKAAMRMRCATDAIADIKPELLAHYTPAELALTKGNDQESFQQLIDEAPHKIVQFIEQKSVTDLRAALSAITLGTPSKDEIAAVFKQYAAASAEGTGPHMLGALPPVVDPYAEDKRKFATAVRNLSTNLATCAITNPQ
jgi:hypothetical protein